MSGDDLLLSHVLLLLTSYRSSGRMLSESLFFSIQRLFLRTVLLRNLIWLHRNFFIHPAASWLLCLRFSEQERSVGPWRSVKLKVKGWGTGEVFFLSWEVIALVSGLAGESKSNSGSGSLTSCHIWKGHDPGWRVLMRPSPFSGLTL